MDQKLKNSLIVVGFGVTLFVVLYRIADIGRALGQLYGILEPVLAGCLIAFVLNVPMVKIEAGLRRLHLKCKKAPNEAVLQVTSLILTIVLVIGIFVLLGAVVIPPLVTSVAEAIRELSINIPIWEAKLQRLGLEADWINTVYTALKDKLQSSSFAEGMNGYVNSIVGQVSSTLGTLFVWLIAFIIAIYLLIGKDMIYRHCRTFAYAYFPAKAVRRTGRFWNTLCRTYADFFSGQCVEACILGFLMFMAFSIFRLPYAGLVAVLTAVSSFIPYVGSFLSCAIGAMLILMIDPMKALVSVIVYTITQFCENQFIYPHVVGRAVGLPALWTLVAVLVGGKIGGILGMIFCIPLTSVFYTQMSIGVSKRLEKKKQRSDETAQSPEPPQE